MFCNTEREYVPVATGNNDSYGGQWMWAIVLFFGLLVFGGNGWFGNRVNNGGGGIDTATAAILSSLGNRGASADAIATDAAVQRGFDTQSIIGKLDGINNGLCDGFYAQNTTMLQGFHGVDNAVCQLGYQTQQGFNGTNMAIMQGNNAIQSQLASCCCGIERNIDSVRYENAKNTCDIITSQNAGVQRILDKMCQQETQALRDESIRNYISSQLFGVVRYPNQTAYTAGVNPFFNYGYGFNGYNNGNCCNNGCGGCC